MKVEIEVTELASVLGNGISEESFSFPINATIILIQCTFHLKVSIDSRVRKFLFSFKITRYTYSCSLTSRIDDPTTQNFTCVPLTAYKVNNAINCLYFISQLIIPQVGPCPIANEFQLNYDRTQNIYKQQIMAINSRVAVVHVQK